MGNMGVLYTLTQKDTYLRFKDTNWIKKTLKMRDYYETGKGTNPFKFMPTVQEICEAEAIKSSETGIIKATQIDKNEVKIFMACDFGMKIPETLITTPNKTW